MDAFEAELPPTLKRLKALVTLLTVAMIAGVITITVLLVIRLNAGAPPVLVHPEVYSIPEGVGTVGYSIVGSRAVIVGDDGVIRIFDAAGGDLVQSFTLD